MPNSNHADSCEQLELIADADHNAAWDGLTADEARSLVNPGWWPVVARLFYPENGLTVFECRELNGSLEIDAE